MNKRVQEQFNKLMIEAEKLKSIINNQEKTKEEMFFELIQGLTAKWDKEEYPDSIFYFKGDISWFEYNEETRYVWVRYHGFWEVFEEEYRLDYQDAKDFLKDMLEEYFKWEGVTPDWACAEWGKELEEHFKCK